MSLDLCQPHAPVLFYFAILAKWWVIATILVVNAV